MSEERLLRHIFERSADLRSAYPHVLVGPGDDCAVLATGPTTLLKVDQVVEGRHFMPGTAVDLIARKAIARAVSDLAGMAGTPRAALAAATIPTGYSRADDLFTACDRWARHFGCPLVGGDISGGPVLALAVTLIGEPHRTRGPVLRSGAQRGDLVWVTGTLGGSFDSKTGQGRHLTFQPRITEAAWLAGHLGDGLHAMMDLSDGLGIDAARLARASGVRLDLDGRSLPLSPTATDWRAALSDGEDYELLFATSPGATVPEEILGTPVTRVGIVVPPVPEPGCWVLGPQGEVVRGDRLGWEHV
jgi:thiamine-monophosphate kinase